MAIRADATVLKSRLRKISRKISGINLEYAGNKVIDNIRDELLNSEYRGQVGFDPEQFIRRLRSTMVVEGKTVIIDPVVAGGDREDLEAIAGLHLWHEGHGRFNDFYRRVYSRAEERASLEAERQAVWQEKTPQWFLINYGATGVNPPQPPQLFLERATRPADVRKMVRAEIRKQLEREGEL